MCRAKLLWDCGHTGGTLEAPTCGWSLPVSPWAVVMRLVRDVLLGLVPSSPLELGLRGCQFLRSMQAPDFSCFPVNEPPSC